MEQCWVVPIKHSVLPLQVAQNMAHEWAIFKVGTSDIVPGPADGWAYVLKGRVSTDEQPSDFEQLAMQRSCLLVVEVRLHSRPNTSWLGGIGHGQNHVQCFAGSLQYADSYACNVMPQTSP